MLLCDRDIMNFLNKGLLSITPDLPLTRISGVSVDISLGNKFRTFIWHNVPFIDLSTSKNEIDETINLVMNDEIELKKYETFYLNPGELVLATTFESITLPSDLVGWLDGRSSLARLGLMVHTTAHRIDPGWSGNIVLELFNVSKLPLVLRPGMIIGALSFEYLTGPVLHPYNIRKDAKYYNQKGVVISRINKD